MTDNIGLQKPCTQCIHCEKRGQLIEVLICDNPDYYVDDPDYVTGTLYAIRHYCRDARDSTDMCGSSGQGWKQKPYEPLAWDLFRAIRKFFAGAH